jgi:hypothetical protein
MNKWNKSVEKNMFCSSFIFFFTDRLNQIDADHFVFGFMLA